jgi:hypothetical protein
MSELGQKAKYSPRANVFCCSSNNGHRSTPSAVRLGAKTINLIGQFGRPSCSAELGQSAVV